MRAKMVGLLELLEEKDNQLREPYSKMLDDRIFEIRCTVGNNITRVVYFFYCFFGILPTSDFGESAYCFIPMPILYFKQPIKEV